MKAFSHITDKNQPKMVDISHKNSTKRSALASAKIFVGEEVISQLTNDELHTKKGPVFQTAIIAGIQAVKKTSELIPMCHPLSIEGVEITIKEIEDACLEIRCRVGISGKTGVEMEALTGASVAALTIYDMCKSITKNMQIKEVQLIEKIGGKSDRNNG